jgi:hypothetical protein
MTNRVGGELAGGLGSGVADGAGVAVSVGRVVGGNWVAVGKGVGVKVGMMVGNGSAVVVVSASAMLTGTNMPGPTLSR